MTREPELGPQRLRVHGGPFTLKRPLHAQVSVPVSAVIPDGMTESRLDETQEARPSGEDPMEARNRLTVQWWLAPLLLIAIAALIVLIKLLF
jgi:hypothetical protein